MKKTIEEYTEFFMLMLEQANKEFNNDEFITKFAVAFSEKIKIKSDLKINEVNSFYEEIKRTRYFLKHIDKEAWIEGLNYYSKVKIPELKIELAKDFKEMKIADKSDEIIEYARRLVMQLENSINSVIEIVDAWSVIQANPNNYKDNYNNSLIGNYSFFFNNGKRKELKDISLPSKLFFVKQFYNFKYFWQPIDEMIKIRNKASHRGEISIQEQQILDNARNNVTSKKSEYFNAFDNVIKNLADLFV